MKPQTCAPWRQIQTKTVTTVKNMKQASESQQPWTAVSASSTSRSQQMSPGFPYDQYQLMEMVLLLNKKRFRVQSGYQQREINISLLIACTPPTVLDQAQASLTQSAVLPALYVYPSSLTQHSLLRTIYSTRKLDR